MHSASYNMLIVTLDVQCCVSSELDFEAACCSTVYNYVIVCSVIFSRALSCCKCDMGVLLWLNAKVHEREPNLHFGKFV